MSYLLGAVLICLLIAIYARHGFAEMLRTAGTALTILLFIIAFGMLSYHSSS